MTITCRVQLKLLPPLIVKEGEKSAELNIQRQQTSEQYWEAASKEGFGLYTLFRSSLEQLFGCSTYTADNSEQSVPIISSVCTCIGHCFGTTM